MQATANLGHHNDMSPPVARRRDVGALIFMATVIFSLIGIAVLARNIFAAAHHLEMAKRNAELVARTLADVGVQRKQNKSEIVACQSRPDDAAKVTWGPCWDAIAQGPELSRLINVMEPTNPIYGATCDGSDEAIGRIIIDKGTPWFSAGNTGTTFAPSDSEDSIAMETPLRIQVCNRWGEPVKVQEIKF